MTALNQIAYFQNRRDEVPNQELARTLEQRLPNMSASQTTRIKRVIKQAEKVEVSTCQDQPLKP